MTHRFHLQFGHDFEFVVHRRNWGEDRVYCRGEDGRLFSLPASWTDVVGEDPFAVIATGRCPFTVDGLLGLAALAHSFRSPHDRDQLVKAIMP